MTDDAARLRKQLGRRLRQARDAAGMTQIAAGAVLGCGQSKIAKMETKLVAISSRDLNKLLAAYDLPAEEQAEIRQLAAQVTPGTSATARSNEPYLDMLAAESEADEILSLNSERIPSLLQSEHYLVAQYELAGNPMDKGVLLASQDDRLEIFGKTSRLRRYRVILAESSVHRMPGGRNAVLVIDQAQHLLKLADTYDQLEIRIVTMDARIAYFPADLTVLKFGGRAKDWVYLESGAGFGRKLTAATAVVEHEDSWLMVHRAALSVDDTRKYLTDLVAAARASDLVL